MAVRKRKRADGSMAYSVRVYRHGEHEYLGTFDTEREAKRVEREEAMRLTTNHRETAGEFALRWVEEYPRNKRSTQKLYEQRARQFASDTEPVRVDNRLVVVSELRMCDVTRPIARAYAMKRRSLHSQLSTMYNDALNDGIVRENPFARLGLPQSRGRADIVALTEEEVLALADQSLHVHGREFGPVFRAMIVFAGFVGIRPGEMFALEWPDIDFKAMEVDVKRRLYDGETDLPKSNVTRRVILPPAAAEAVQSMPRRLTTGRPYVFTTKRGAPFRRARLGDYWLPVWQRFDASLSPERSRELRESRPKDRRTGEPKEHADFYELRHSAATSLLERGVAAEDVAIQLGHQDGGELIRRLYGHPSVAAARQRLHDAYKAPVADLSVAREKREAANG